MTFQKRRHLTLVQGTLSESAESEQTDSLLNIIDILEMLEETTSYERFEEDFDDDLEEDDGYFDESGASAIIVKGSDMGRAFAICEAKYKKGDSGPLGKISLKKDDYSSKMNNYEKALGKAKLLHKKKGG